jgi:hypothetical protein
MGIATILARVELQGRIDQVRREGDRVSEARYICELASHYVTSDTPRYLDFLLAAASIYESLGLSDEAAYVYRSISHTYRYYVHDFDSAMRYMHMACDAVGSQGMRGYLEILLTRLSQARDCRGEKVKDNTSIERQPV